MRPGRDALARAVDSVVEGTGAVDWGLMTIELHNERDRELLRHIRAPVADSSDVQRAEAGRRSTTRPRCARAPRSIASIAAVRVPSRASRTREPMKHRR